MDDIFEKCFFKFIYTRKRLYILCKAEEENEELISKNLTKELYYDNIHWLYIFRIQPFQLYGKLKSKELVPMLN